MTTLAAKVSVDARGASGLYILSDSRITWISPHKAYWDAGQKVFCSRISADIFGFCGDALFPPCALRQVVDIVHSGVLFSEKDDAEYRHCQVFSVFRSIIKSGHHLPIGDFSIIHGARDGELMSSRFRLWIVCFHSKSATWKQEEIDFHTSHSHLCFIGGSGQKIVRKYEKQWNDTLAKNTSRAAFGSVCDALFSEEDENSMGPPQLVGLWRKGVAQQFGIIWCGKRYFSGVQVPDGSRFCNVHWFNQRFERMDGERIKLLPGAQRQPKPSPAVNKK